MNAIARCFTDLGNSGRRTALIPYVMAGDPDIETSLGIMMALADNGADIIELGVPFSDPTADGPSIQRAAERALAAGSGLTAALGLAARFRSQGRQTPLVLMGYANPVHAMGIAEFAEAAGEASVDGVLVVDMPFGEDADLAEMLDARGMALIRLAAPTTPPERLALIAAAASGFIYYVTLAGVTGAGLSDLADVEAGVGRVRAAGRGGDPVAVAVGFGIKTAPQAAAVARFSDAVVVGSTLVDIVGTCVEQERKSEAPGRVGAAVRQFADALNEIGREVT